MFSDETAQLRLTSTDLHVAVTRCSFLRLLRQEFTKRRAAGTWTGRLDGAEDIRLGRWASNAELTAKMREERLRDDSVIPARIKHL